MKCNNCGYALKKEWHYCPICGFAVEKWYEKVGVGIEDLLQSLLKSIFLKKAPHIDIKVSAFQLTPHAHNLMTSSNFSAKKKKIREDQKFIREVNEVVEPDTNIVKGEDFAEVELNVPGVSNIDDVFVVLYDNSAEIRAYTADNKKMYFKIVEIPPYADVVDRVLRENGKLIIRFEVLDEEDI